MIAVTTAIGRAVRAAVATHFMCSLDAQSGAVGRTPLLDSSRRSTRVVSRTAS